MSNTDLRFVETNTEMVKTSLITSFEKIVGRTLYPADPERLFVLWVAQIIVQLRVMINETARQNLSRYAKGEKLDALAELFHNVSRLPETYATTTIRFYFSTVLDNAQLIPEGTRITTSNGIVFETEEAAYVPVGSQSVEVSAKCQKAGEIGNGILPGQLTQLVDGFPYYDHCENITTSQGGSAKENDESLYHRMRASEDTYSTAGPMGGYEYFAKSASGIISDVRATSPTPGCVNVYLLLRGGELPNKEVIEAVLEALSDDTVRPLTDHVAVLPPETIGYSIDLTYYVPADANAESIAAAVIDAVDKYKAWQSEKLGRDINPDQLLYLLKQAGVKRAEIRQPVFTPVSDGRDHTVVQVAMISEESIQNGGYEDD